MTPDSSIHYPGRQQPADSQEWQQAGLWYSGMEPHVQAHAALWSSDTLFRAIFNNASIGMALTDPGGRILVTNEANSRLLGYGQHELVGSHFSMITHPDDVTLDSTLYASLVAGARDRYVIDKRFVRKDGTIVWGRITVSLLQHPDSCERYTIVLCEDIHNRKQAEEEKRRGEIKQQGLNRVVKTIRNSLDLTTIFLTATREIGQLLDAERVGIIQYCPDEGVWRSVADYRCTLDLPDALGLELPDRDNQVAALLKRQEMIRLNDASTLPDGINSEIAQAFPGAWLLIPLAIGTTVWGSLSLVKPTAQAPWHDAEVELALAVADHLIIAIQQSELYQQVQQLNANLEQQVAARTAQLELAVHYEAICKRISDQVRDFLDEGSILRTAVQELAQALELESCDTALYNDDRTTSTIYCDYTKHLPSAQGTVVQICDVPEHQLLLQGQSIQFCFLSMRFDPVRPSTGQATILACPMMDDQGVLGDLWLFRRGEAYFGESEVRLVQQVANQCAIALRQAQLYQTAQAQVAELERLNQFKDDFLSTVSHELRAPMANIKMATHLLELFLKPLNVLDARSNRYLQILRDECQRETDLINDLLDLSRLETDATKLTLTCVDLTTWFPQIAEPFQERTQTHQQQLILAISPDLPTVMTDLSYLRRILTELLHNACKYTPAGETITLSAKADLTSLRISVSNTGVEISRTEYDRIFDKFYRIPNNDPWKYGGTGLGLALVKKLAERLTATIQVDSSANQTSFTLRLAIAQTAS